MKVKLIKMSDLYKLTIPKNVEHKIRVLCNLCPDKEWSGILFYTVKGSFDKDLEIICKDILQMDIGTVGFTEFKMNPKVINYMTDHPELLKNNIYQGLVH